jgi:hypothetical protein
MSILILLQSCNEPTKDSFNPIEEYTNINNAINNQQVDSLSGENYTFWIKNKEIVKLYIFEGDGENYATHEEYFFNNKKVFAFQKKQISFPNAIDYKVLIHFNETKIVSEKYWIDNDLKNKKELSTYLITRGLNFENEVLLDNVNNKAKYLLTIDELSKRYGLKNWQIKNETQLETSSTKQTTSEYKNFREIQLELVDGSLNKAKLYLGEPDVYEPYMGHITKGFVLYKNIVENNGDTPKHLVLFLRSVEGSNNPDIEEIYSVSDFEKACFGIHCIEIREGEIFTNALDLINIEGYKSINQN